MGVMATREPKMTNERAVNYLRLNKPTSGYPGLCEAIDIAIAALAAPPQPEVDAAPALKLTAVMCDISGIAAGALDHASYRTVVVKLTGDQCAALKSRNGYESIERAIVESVE